MDIDRKIQKLFASIQSIEAQSGPCAFELISIYHEIFVLFDYCGNHSAAASYLMKYYLVLEINYFDNPLYLLNKVIVMARKGYLYQSVMACNSLVYLLFESGSLDPQLLQIALRTLMQLHQLHPEPTARKLIGYAKSLKNNSDS